jgi:hypothetical protein
LVASGCLPQTWWHLVKLKWFIVAVLANGPIKRPPLGGGPWIRPGSSEREQLGELGPRGRLAIKRWHQRSRLGSDRGQNSPRFKKRQRPFPIDDDPPQFGATQLDRGLMN